MPVQYKPKMERMETAKMILRKSASLVCNLNYSTDASTLLPKQGCGGSILITLFDQCVDTMLLLVILNRYENVV